MQFKNSGKRFFYIYTYIVCFMCTHMHIYKVICVYIQTCMYVHKYKVIYKFRYKLYLHLYVCVHMCAYICVYIVCVYIFLSKVFPNLLIKQCD